MFAKIERSQTTAVINDTLQTPLSSKSKKNESGMIDILCSQQK